MSKTNRSQLVHLVLFRVFQSARAVSLGYLCLHSEHTEFRIPYWRI